MPLLSFQQRVRAWAVACFGAEIAYDKRIRNFRFLEEALELVQAGGCIKAEAMELVHYVYGRPIGETPQEIGGVRVTLAALCEAYGQDEDTCADVELTRCWEKIEKIRAKQAAKMGTGSLPGLTNPEEQAKLQVRQDWELLLEVATRLNNVQDGAFKVASCMGVFGRNHHIISLAVREITK